MFSRLATPLTLSRLVEASPGVLLSMTVRVSLLHEAEPGGTARPATTGEFVMVAVDDSGRAVAVRRGASDA